MSEYMQDYDRLNSGRINTDCFYRALQSCKILLNSKELEALAKQYAVCINYFDVQQHLVMFLFAQSPKNPGYVDYTRFSDDVESSFTLKGLETSPGVTPVPVPDMNSFQFL